MMKRLLKPSNRFILKVSTACNCYSYVRSETAHLLHRLLLYVIELLDSRTFMKIFVPLLVLRRIL